MDTNRDAYHQKMTAQINEWTARVDVLRAKADKASAEAKLELNKKLEGLKDLEKQAAAMLDRVKSATGDAWNDAKKSVDEGWHKVTAAFDAAVEKGHEKMADGAHKVSDEAHKGADKIAAGAQQGANKIAAGAQQGANKISNAADKVAKS